jgi:uncharacterized membrane protein YfcA
MIDIFIPRLLIDWDSIMMIQPMTLAGTIIGVLLNRILPPWLTTVLLIIVLTAASTRMIQKGREIWARESINAQAKTKAIGQNHA